MNILECDHVYKIFGRDKKQVVQKLKDGVDPKSIKGATVAVNDVSFDVKEGEIFVVMGLSGSGKSTLLRTLNALGPATAGTVKIKGTDITKLKPAELRKVRQQSMSMVFQHFALLPHRTVLENAAYPLEIAGVSKEEREAKARHELQVAGLEGREDSYPSQLSGGMQQRVGLARALCAEGDILLMDEAFSALDPLIRRDMQELLLEIQARSKRTIIFITHDLNEAMLLGNRIAVMRNGQIVQVGTAEEILTNPANDYVAKFVQDVDRSRVITASSIMRRPVMRIYLNDGPRVVLRKLEETDLQGGWVTASGDRRLHGYVEGDEIADALSKNPNLDPIRDLVHYSHPGISADTPLSEIILPSASKPIPVPVVSKDGRLEGIIGRVALLRALGEGSGNEVTPVSTGSIPKVDQSSSPTQEGSGASASSSASEGPKNATVAGGRSSAREGVAPASDTASAAPENKAGRGSGPAAGSTVQEGDAE